MEQSRVDVGGIKKVKKGTLKDQVAAQIKQEILSNHWRPNQPIVIDEVANELGISHTPIREALAMLLSGGDRVLLDAWEAGQPVDVVGHSEGAAIANNAASAVKSQPCTDTGMTSAGINPKTVKVTA